MQVLAINHSLFFFSLPDVILHTSLRNCFARRLFGNYSEGGCGAASVSRRWKSRWGETGGRVRRVQELPAVSARAAMRAAAPWAPGGWRPTEEVLISAVSRHTSSEHASPHQLKEGRAGRGGDWPHEWKFARILLSGCRRKKCKEHIDTKGQIAAGSDFKDVAFRKVASLSVFRH